VKDLQWREEGCLCLPEISVNVERKEHLQIRGIDKKGNPVTFDAEGLLSVPCSTKLTISTGRLSLTSSQSSSGI